MDTEAEAKAKVQWQSALGAAATGAACRLPPLPPPDPLAPHPPGTDLPLPGQPADPALLPPATHLGLGV